MFTIKTTTRIATILAAAAIGTGITATARAQTYYSSPQTYTVQQSYPSDAIVLLSQSQLETLTGAIALYPDALVAQILPAATYPVDVVQAARLARSGVSAYQIDQYDIDPSVKAIAHYPSIIGMLDQNLAWTEQLGQAFIAQPGDVMQAIQTLRWRAQGTGVLCSTPQQQVFIESNCVRIVPANPAVIYVPTYDPAVCYQTTVAYRSSPAISFGIGFDCGSWFDLDIDWGRRTCYRPGWTWNRWNDNFIVEHNRTIRPRIDYGRDSTVWRRDSNRPSRFTAGSDHGRNNDRSRDWGRTGSTEPSRDWGRSGGGDRTGNASRDWSDRSARATPAPTNLDRGQRGNGQTRQSPPTPQVTRPAEPRRETPRAASTQSARIAAPPADGPRRLTASHASQQSRSSPASAGPDRGHDKPAARPRGNGGGTGRDKDKRNGK